MPVNAASVCSFPITQDVHKICRKRGLRLQAGTFFLNRTAGTQYSSAVLYCRTIEPMYVLLRRSISSGHAACMRLPIPMSCVPRPFPTIPPRALIYLNLFRACGKAVVEVKFWPIIGSSTIIEQIHVDGQEAHRYILYSTKTL